MFGGELPLSQAPMFDDRPLDPFALLDDGWSSAEVGVGGCHVAKAVIVTLAVTGGRFAQDPLSMCPHRLNHNR